LNILGLLQKSKQILYFQNSFFPSRRFKFLSKSQPSYWMSNCLESVNVSSIEGCISDCRREMCLSICAGHATLVGISWSRLNLKQVIQGVRETNFSDTRLRKSTHVSSWMLWDRNIFLSKRKRNKFDARVTAVAISASWFSMWGEVNVGWFSTSLPRHRRKATAPRVFRKRSTTSRDEERRQKCRIASATENKTERSKVTKFHASFAGIRKSYWILVLK